MKRRFSLILAVVLALALVAVIPFATTAFDTETTIGDVETGYTPEGTAVTTPEEFAAMTADGSYYLANNITIDATYEGDFTGKLDGNGKIITTSAPLFKNLKGEVKNLKITGTVTVSNYDAGALAQRAHGATVSNVLNHASVTGSTTVIALAESEYYYFKNLTSEEGTTHNTYKLAGTGGLIGSATGVCAFTDCLNLGDINGSPAGGIVGVMGYDTDAASFTFVNCHNEGKITDVGTDDTNMPATQVINYITAIGGIGGFAVDFKTVSFESCTNKGAVKSTLEATRTKSNGDIVDVYPSAGGIFGAQARHANTNVNEGATVSFTSCVNNGAVDANYNAGGIMGGSNDGIAAGGTFFTNCTNKADITTKSSRCGGIVGDSSASTFVGCENFGKITGTIHLGGIAGRAYSDASFKDCVNNGVIDGVYAGGGYQSATAGIGGYMNGTVTAVNCHNTASISNPNGASVGGVFGDINGGNTSIDNCSNSGSVTGKYYVAGIVGYPEGAITISNCKNTAEAITGEYRVGGILGRASNTVAASYCVNYGTVNATSVNDKNAYAGGIAASTKTGVYSDCINYGDVNATKGGRAVGGIVGYFGAKDGGGETVIRCGNHGDITNGDAWTGGICGYVYAHNDNTLIDSCYNVGDIKGTNSSGGAIGYISVKGTHTITVKNSFFAGTYTSTKADGVSTISGYNSVSTTVMTNVYYSAVATHEGFTSSTSNIALNPNTTASAIASGELAYTLNAAAKAADPSITEDIFYQTIGTDAHPVLDNTHKAVLKLADGTYANEIPEEPEVTTPEVTTPEVTTPEETTPEETTPEVTTPEVTTPEETTPEVTTPEVTTPEETTPEVTTPEETTPEVTTPAETTPAEPEPPIVGDSIATIIVVCAIAFVVIGAAVAMVVIKRKENN